MKSPPKPYTRPSRQPSVAKRKRMTEKSVAIGAAYGKRLDRGYYHFPTAVPEDKKKSTVCQLHRLAHTSIHKDNKIPDGARKDVMICKDCDAAICIQCWGVFHSKETFEKGDFCQILEPNN